MISYDPDKIQCCAITKEKNRCLPITQQELKLLLSYNADTGIFTWISNTGKSNIKIKGTTAGTTHTYGYINIVIYRKHYYAHRLAFLYMNGEFPAEYVDHINRIKNDNRWSNLREATRSENNYNSLARSHNKCGIKGVRADGGKWTARIGFLGKSKHLGTFNSPEEASSAYLSAAKEFHGDFLCCM